MIFRNISEGKGYVTNNDGSTALVLASSKGNLEVMKFLFELRADIDAADKDREIALLTASGSGHLEVVKYLIEKGADVNAADEQM